jgi:sulfate permease, SulP family
VFVIAPKGYTGKVYEFVQVPLTDDRPPRSAPIPSGDRSDGAGAVRGTGGRAKPGRVGPSPYGDDAPPFKPRSATSVVARTFPVTQQLPNYPKRSLRRDLVSGITVAALAIPAGMAYAQLVGLPPTAGLYALLLPAVAYVFLGSSRQLIVGPEGSLSLLVATGVMPLAHGDPARYATLVAMLCVVVAGIYFVGRLVRIGWVADYFSRAVLVGYIHGVAVVLVCGQLGKLFGIPISASEPLAQLREFFSSLNQIHGLTVVVGALSVALLVVVKWRWPKIPGALIVVVLGIAASYAFHLSSHGVKVVGPITAGLPSIDWPGVGLHDVVDLIPVAAGIFAVGYSDAVLTARSFAGRHSQHVDANQELFALGVANFAAGVTHSFPVGASGSRTAVNDQTGGKTQLVGLVAAGIVALVLVFLTAPVEKLPNACLGAVIVVAALGLVEPSAWTALATAGRNQVVIAGTALVGVVALGVLRALLVAVALSILDVAVRSAKPHDAVLGWVGRLGRYADVSLHSSAKVTPGVVVYRLDDQLIFTNARYVKGRVLEAVHAAPTPTAWLVFDAEAVTAVDASGVEAIEQLIGALGRQHIRLAVSRLKEPVRQQFDATELTQAIGDDNFYPTTEFAVRGCAADMAEPNKG